MNIENNQQRQSEYEQLCQFEQNQGLTNWLLLLRDLDKTKDHNHSVMRLPYSSSWLFTTGTEVSWAVDPAPYTVGTTGIDQIVAALRDFTFCIISHLHSDHCQPDFLNRFVDSESLYWIIPTCITEKFTRIVKVRPEKLISMSDETIEIEGLKITCSPGFHDEPGNKPVASGAFTVDLPDQIKLSFPGDIRDFSQDLPEHLKDADYLFAHLWLGREIADQDNFPLLTDYCYFLLRQRPKQIIFGHLLEISRPLDSMWNYRHASLVIDELQTITDRQMTTPICLVPHNGDTRVLDKQIPNDYYVSWSDEQRENFNSNLGCAIKNKVLAQIDQAIADKIPVLELNYHTLPGLDNKTLLDKLTLWRSSGGTVLSLHLPEILLDKEDPEWEQSVIALVHKLGCQRVTAHVPNCNIKFMKDNKNYVLSRFTSALLPLVENGVKVGIENMHMSKPYLSKKSADNCIPAALPSRRYGFTIDEWLEIVSLLREQTGSQLFGCHLDVGHAYTNYPFHVENTLVTWIKAGGTLINGVHIHQYEQDRSVAQPYPQGHHHVSGRNAGYPNLQPLYKLWADKVFAAPMFLEICRGSESEPFASRKRLVSSQ